MPRRGQGVHHRIDDELARAVNCGCGASNDIEGVKQSLSSDERWRLLGVQEEFGVGDYWWGVHVGSC